MRTVMKNCPASQGDEPRRVGRGLTPMGTTPDSSTDNINGSEKGEKSLLCMGNPSGSEGHLPCKAEEFCLRTDKLFAAIDFKSVAAYQRGSMKPFFPTEFRLRQSRSSPKNTDTWPENLLFTLRFFNRLCRL